MLQRYLKLSIKVVASSTAKPHNCKEFTLEINYCSLLSQFTLVMQFSFNLHFLQF